ncbi:ABC transporter ATP-binding protein [Sediminibacillus massiliensis]|uniref:ABC transporter ATP-binding protein n=1 Tax=Sediminibacillus massiliensis TaxID=1926277 RepID=UPI00098852C4|nr:ABC transporter ATP-binding protein [Sediminibacillus massiliensis]
MTVVAGVENLRLKYPGTDSLLMKDFTLSIEQGEKVLIIGPSGSGKSTLLQVMTGLIPASVEVPMKADGLKIPLSWGYLFQDPDSQFCMPYVDEELAFVLENLRVPSSEMRNYMSHYLEQVGLSFDNLHTSIQTLSGGMKQRLAIASVLALEADTLFLDEPTAMLDPAGTKEVWETIKGIANDKTCIIVEHKIDQIIEFVDRVILLDEKGEIRADGSANSVFEANKQVLREQGIWYPSVWEDYLETKPKNVITSLAEAKPLISLSGFTGYRGGTETIKIQKADVFPGEWITIIGENGAGKSTLLHALMKLVKTKGYYYLFEKEYKKTSDIAKYISFVFQNPELQFVTNSAAGEVAYSLERENWSREAIDHKVGELLDRYRLTAERDNHPYQLSMGQKRRLSVASAVVKEQPVLLLDEPTFGQDAANTFTILEQLEELQRRGTTIMMVTHDRNIVKNFATRVWEIENGMLAKDVSTVEFFHGRAAGSV